MEVLQVPSELERALALRDKLNPRRILEIGCWDGGTLREWLTATPPPELVVAVSLEHHQPEAYPQWTHTNTDLVIGTGRSQSPEMLEVIRNNAPYDWAFIDGDHAYQAAREDFDNVKPLINQGGVILLHDITPGVDPETAGPRQLLNELLDEGFRIDVYDSEPLPWSAGIGVVYL